MDDVATVHVRIEGKVQRVWYRAWTVDEATRRGLSGWVRNRADGSVEAVFSGRETLVKDMVEACWTGSPRSQVTNVTSKPADVAVVPGFREIADV